MTFGVKNIFTENMDVKRSLVKLGLMLGGFSWVLFSSTPIFRAEVAVANPTKGYIVVLKDNFEPSAVALEHANANAFTIDFTYKTALKGYAAKIPQARLAALSKDPRVLFISEDLPVQALGKTKPQPETSSVEAIPQTLPTGVNRTEADISSTKAGDSLGQVNVAIAILDTGIDTRHPDLNVRGGKNCVTKTYNDGNGHGTHVAGIAAAKDNADGVVGVAPGAPLYAVKVLDNNGSGTTSSVLCGIDWVTANAASTGIKVANMSLGGTGSRNYGNCSDSNNDALYKAICNSITAGVTYVVAAGNSNIDFATSFPASYDEVLTVTAFADFNGQPGGGATPTCRATPDDKAADFSNFTSINSPDANHTIAAPGVCINSTWKGSTYNTISGTSMAAPHVAGAVALCLSSGQCTGLSPQQIMQKLRNDAASQSANYSYGFQDDPNSPNGTRYYGNAVYTGGY
ncbi:MAG: S8 family peptidase [Leptolyngbyaceae bacterium]|nr:S8 family peptidase [Leptolyngbyaceae bacterium]